MKNRSLRDKSTRACAFAALAAMLLLAARPATAQTYTKLHEFSADRGLPQAAMTESSNGVLWGTTYLGGVYGMGSVFTLTPNGVGGFTYAEPHSFTGGTGAAGSPSALVQASDGKMYGITQNGLNQIYRIDANGNNFEQVYELNFFTEGYGSTAALIQGSDGLLYGTAPYGGVYGNGTAFSFDPSAGTLHVIHDFKLSNGVHPGAPLLEGSDGRLYGTAESGGAGFRKSDGNETFEGTVFRMDKSGANFVVLHSFTGADGAAPEAELIQLSDGFLYGTTLQSDAFLGTVFKLDTDGHNFQTLHQFTVAEGREVWSGLVQAADGLLYGTTNTSTPTNDGIVFRMTTTGASFQVVHSFVNAEGIRPAGTLLRGSDGFLYGVTQYDGAGGYGAVYRVDPTTTNFAVQHSFSGRDAFWSVAALKQGPGGWLYGTSAGGGSLGHGTVFKVDPSGTTYTILRNFSKADGIAPEGSLIIGTDGFLYGTTHGGFGSAGTGYGSVFRMATDGSSFSVLHTFTLGDGSTPFGGVIQGADGFLYGTTGFGGFFGQGVVYRVSTAGTNFSILHEFDVGTVYAPVLQGNDGKLYGVTYYGGAQQFGNIFRLDTSGSNFEVIHAFNNADGYGPYGGLIQPADGKLYGTTFQGGIPEFRGVVYRLDPSGSNFEVLHAFNIGEGKFSFAPLFLASDGFLYGTTSQGGTTGMGTVFRMTPAGGNFEIVHSFGDTDGGSLYGGLIQGADGALYGTTRDGGTFNGGVIFRFEPDSAQARRPRLVGPR